MNRLLRILAGVVGRGPRARTLHRAVAGRVVLVTGASEGIGAATARQLGAAGATVLLVARTVARLDQVAAEITAAGGSAHVHPCDLADPAAAARLGEEVLRRHGRVDVVVSNAGRSIHRSVAATADRFHDLSRTAGVNYLGPVALLLALLPAMRAARSGHIVNVSTASLAVDPPGWSAYLASKAAFDHWLRCAAPELRVDGVTVSTIYCGLVRTRMSAPTAGLRRLPAASAQEAGAMVCRAVAHRPRSWWPWWARLGQVLLLFPATLERLYAVYLRATEAAAGPQALWRVGALRPGSLWRAGWATRRHGATLAAALAAGPGKGAALIDEDGCHSGRELTVAARQLARRLAPLTDADRVGLACAGGRNFVVAALALDRLRVDVVPLSPDTPAATLPTLVAAHGIQAIVHDGRFGSAPVPSWDVQDDSLVRPVVPFLQSDQSIVDTQRRVGRLTVLTSGSTGLPRAVRRPLSLRMLLGPIGTHLRLVPLYPGRPFVLVAPPHHGYGLAYLAAGLALGVPVILAAGLTAEQTLDLAAEHGADVLIALPVQLRRLVAQAENRLHAPRLRAIVSGAEPLPTDLHTRLVRAFGDVVHNLYGTTEAGWSAIATPADLAAAPGTVGRAPRGVRLVIRDAQGRMLPPGQVGEVFVGGWLPSGAEVPTGDLGLLDPVGRLMLHGRVDDMIISGGVNVYPGPVAAVLATHPDIVAVDVVPVADPEFGQRLAARVRLREGSVLTSDELRAWQREYLPPAQRARDITFVEG